jgi:CO/xanthine dehydrogenase Mo-binding subunit
MTTYNTIGKSLPRVDARGKVTGETPYSGDLSLPGMLHMKMLFAGRPHARHFADGYQQGRSRARRCHGLHGKGRAGQ